MKSKFCILVCLFAVFILVGCSQDGQNVEDSSKSSNKSRLIDYTSNLNIQSEKEHIINSSYPNLLVSDSFYIDCPENIEIIPLLKITSPYELAKEDFDLDVYYEKIIQQFNLFFPDVEYNSEYLFCNANVADADSFYPTVNKCYDRIKNNGLEFDWFEYNDNNIYIVWSRSNNDVFPYRMTKGVAHNLSDSDKDLSAWLPADSCQLVAENIPSTESDKVEYNLNSGKVNLKSAIDYAENEYMSQFSIQPELGINVPSTDVYKVNEDIYGYHFNARLTYNDIPFDSLKESSGMSASSDGKEYKFPICHLFMVDEKNIDFLLGFDVNYFYKEIGEINQIVSAKQAVQIASDTLTRNVEFELKSVDLVYSQSKDNDTKLSAFIARPEWKVTTFNPNDSYNYVVYVDAETGNSRYQKFSD